VAPARATAPDHELRGLALVLTALLCLVFLF
jgi:hypothetical protein